MLISVAIPAYNRPSEMSELLASVVSQGCRNFEIVICEDCSPARSEIREIVRHYQRSISDIDIHYHENESNYGYDRNLRTLLHKSRGDYVMFMGNDDLMAEGAIEAVHQALTTVDNVGVLLRSYSSFRHNLENIIEPFHYFDQDRVFYPGVDAAVTFFRRSVFISGMVFDRAAAVECETDRFDGSLLYQQYLVGNLLQSQKGYYCHQVISHQRLGGVPDFGMSDVEKNKFVPREQTSDSSIFFISGMLDIAKSFDNFYGSDFSKKVTKDLANYSYPFIAIQDNLDRKYFLKYIIELSRLGLGKYLIFWTYGFGVFFLRRTFCDYMIRLIKKLNSGKSPQIGKFSSGSLLK